MNRMVGCAAVPLRSGGHNLVDTGFQGIPDKPEPGVIRYPAPIWPGGFFAEACLQTHQVW